MEFKDFWGNFLFKKAIFLQVGSMARLVTRQTGIAATCQSHSTEVCATEIWMTTLRKIN
jgi:hypothetical protein